jgi:hypothetical protein
MAQGIVGEPVGAMPNRYLRQTLVAVRCEDAYRVLRSIRRENQIPILRREHACDTGQPGDRVKVAIASAVDDVNGIARRMGDVDTVVSSVVGGMIESALSCVRRQVDVPEMFDDQSFAGV